ncbi:putative serpin-Z5 [Lolium perenne]|uniref:putative serpin-Z5 n=1 Tax=Lolium perenne TaxID=4522 RepID=UPI0021F65392|nr:putative serpin-Z5 [Lolium perenne]
MDSTATTTKPLGPTALALRLLGELAETGAHGSNLIFSPLSIYAALALTAAGARGATLQEFLAVLGASSRDELADTVRGLAEQALADRSLKGGPRVSFACGVWHDQTRQLKPAFRRAAAQAYKADTRAVDFRQQPAKAVKQINAWAAAATNNLIDSLLTDGQVSRQTDVIVANAVYFKGRWQDPFLKEYTVDGKFHRLDGSTFDVPFMRSWGREYIACHDGFKVLQLPYKQGMHDRFSPPPRFSMCIFLPDARNGLAGLINTIASSSSSDFMREHLPTSLVKVGKFRLPRFKLTFSGDMSTVLQSLGLQAAFDEEEADLHDMAEGERPLALQSIVHKAVIEVNEDGTEAAAVTGSMMCGASFVTHAPVDFVADHPFAFFVIEERSGAIVFAGTVLEPSPTVPGEKRLRRTRVHANNVDVRPVQWPTTNENANQGQPSRLHRCLRNILICVFVYYFIHFLFF